MYDLGRKYFTFIHTSHLFRPTSEIEHNIWIAEISKGPERKRLPGPLKRRLKCKVYCVSQRYKAEANPNQVQA